MKVFKVPIKVTTIGWVEVEAEGMNEATLIAEHMHGHVVKPAWDVILKDRRESYVVETGKIKEMEAALEPS